VWQAERPSSRRGEQRPGIINGDDCREGMRLRERDDPCRRAGDILEVEPEVAAVHQAGQCRPVLRADHDLDVETRGRSHEIVGPIGAARDQQQDAGHLS